MRNMTKIQKDNYQRFQQKFEKGKTCITEIK